MSKKSKKKNKKRFWFGLGIYACVVIIVICIVWIVFWNYIKEYEESMPSNGVEKIIAKFNSGDIDGYLKELTDLSEFEGKEDIANYIKSLPKGKFDCIKAKDYTDKKPIYVLKNDKDTVARIYMKPVGKNKHFRIWGFDKLEIDKSVCEVSVTITAPSSANVVVNGKTLGESYKTGEKKYEDLTEAYLYSDSIPKQYTYEIKGLLKKPAVSCEGYTEEIKDNTYTYTFKSDETVEAEHKDYVKKVTRIYAYNFINVIEERLSTYVMPDSNLRETVKYTDTYFYPVEYMRSYDLTKQEISNYIKYSDDCFSCDAILHATAYFSGWSVSEKTEKSNIRCIFVYKDKKWYLTDVIFLD